MISDDATFELPSRRPDGRLRRWAKRGCLAAAFLIFAAAVALGFFVWNRANQILANQSAATGSNTQTVARALEIVVSPDAPGLGPRDAKVTVVEFSDFQCPYCGEMYPVMKKLQQRYADRVRFVYRDFPLYDIHPQAVAAAMAGACAHEQGKFWEMHDLLFANQANLTEEVFKTNAIQIGLDSVAFSECYQSGKYLSRIEQSLRDGVSAGVEATPTFFVNNIRIAGAVSLDTLESAILNQLNQ